MSPRKSWQPAEQGEKYVRPSSPQTGSNHSISHEQSKLHVSPIFLQRISKISCTFCGICQNKVGWQQKSISTLPSFA